LIIPQPDGRSNLGMRLGKPSTSHDNVMHAGGTISVYDEITSPLLGPRNGTAYSQVICSSNKASQY
ncbi:MAG: hypothetical protein K6U74_18585, partial [Firmicutes bacterium]|nr:hypothetical protein [Bacillota bacterium]